MQNKFKETGDRFAKSTAGFFKLYKNRLALRKFFSQRKKPPAFAGGRTEEDILEARPTAHSMSRTTIARSTTTTGETFFRHLVEVLLHPLNAGIRLCLGNLSC